MRDELGAVFKVAVYCNQLGVTVSYHFFFFRVVSMYGDSTETAQPPQSDTIRQSFYAVPLQKYDANTALEFS